MNPVALARAYLELSNAGDLDRIFPRFDADAAYRSSQVGAYHGRDAIAGMMREFFARYPDASWSTPEIRPLDPDGAEFDFVMTADEGRIERRGRERIWFTPDGLIRRVEVDVSQAG